MKQSISELSNLTGMDRRRIRRALADLPSDKGKKGAILYESVDALPLLYLIGGDDESFDLTDERARLAHYQANKAALEAHALRGKLIEIDLVGDIVGSDFANVRARLLSIPTKLAPQVVGVLNIAECKACIEAAIVEALGELSADEAYSNESLDEDL